MVAFCLTVQKFHRLFCVESLDCDNRFQNGICVVPFQKKSKQEKGQKWQKTPRSFRFVTLPLEIPDKIKFHPWEFYKIVLDPLEFQVKNQEPRPMEIPHIFWIILRNFTSFLLTPGISILFF